MSNLFLKKTTINIIHHTPYLQNNIDLTSSLKLILLMIYGNPTRTKSSITSYPIDESVPFKSLLRIVVGDCPFFEIRIILQFLNFSKI